MAYTPSSTMGNLTGAISQAIFRGIPGCTRVDCSHRIDGGYEVLVSFGELRVPCRINFESVVLSEFVDMVAEEVRRVMVDIPQAKKELLDRYPGKNPNVLHHIDMAIRQLTEGQTVGVRMTPVVSFWLMRDKWKGRGSAWQMYQPDGDIRVAKDVNSSTGCIYPDILQLAYFITTDGLVCQLAYTYSKDQHFARDICNYPGGWMRIEDERPKVKAKEERASPADEIVVHMGAFL